MRAAVLLVLLASVLLALAPGLSECRLRYVEEGEGEEGEDGAAAKADARVGAKQVGPESFESNDLPHEIQHEMGQVIELDAHNFDASVRPAARRLARGAPPASPLAARETDRRSAARAPHSRPSTPPRRR